jgi:hypothetical protein
MISRAMTTAELGEAMQRFFAGTSQVISEIGTIVGQWPWWVTALVVLGGFFTFAWLSD